MENKTYNWGIIGPGRIAHKFAQALARSPRARLQAVASRSADRAREFASQYGAPHHYDSYEALAKNPDVDIVYIATPHPYHHPHSLLCLQQGKAVLCEKPLGINARQVAEVQQAARRHQAFLMEAIWTRFHPNLLTCQEWIQAGKIGDPRYLRADFGFFTPFDPESRLYNMKLGGGALLDIGIYPLFLAQTLFGNPVAIQAQASLSPTGSDQWVAMQIRYAQGRVAQLHASVAYDTPITAEIFGPHAFIKIHNRWHEPGPISLHRRNECLEQIDFPEDLGYFYEIESVMDNLDKGNTENPLLPHAFSLQLAQTMDEIRRQCGIIYPDYD
jgi:predicted dehydrogenase